MKIATVIWSLGPGGSERVLSTLANRLSDDQSVAMFTIETNGADHYLLSDAVQRFRYVRSNRPRLSNAGAAPHPRSNEAHRTNLWNRATAPLKEARVVQQLRRFVLQFSPDVVVSFVDRTNVQVLMATRGLGVPVVVSERVDPRFHEIPWKARVLRRVLYPRADAVVVQTEAAAAWAEGFIDTEQVWVIPNPVAPCEVETIERERMLLGAGRLEAQKGFDVLIEGFGRVVGEFPDWELVILGEGPQREALEQQAAGLGIEDRVSLPGVVDDPETFMARAGVFVLSSRYEGFPNVLLEAMSCGATVIAADCPSGPAEIIDPGEDGLLIPSEDPAELAAALRRLMSDPGERQRLGANATESVKRYSLDTILEQWKSLFEAVTTNQRKME